MTCCSSRMPVVSSPNTSSDEGGGIGRWPRLCRRLGELERLRVVGEWRRDVGGRSYGQRANEETDSKPTSRTSQQNMFNRARSSKGTMPQLNAAFARIRIAPNWRLRSYPSQAETNMSPRREKSRTLRRRSTRGRSGWCVMLVRAIRLVRSGSNQHVKQICLKTQSFNQHVKRICQTNAKFEPTCQTNVKQMPTTNCLCLQKGVFSFGIFSIGDIQSWDVQLESMQYHAR